MSQPIIIRHYATDRAYQADAEAMARQGYRVQNAIKERPRTGCLRILFYILTGGIGWLFFRPKPQWVVTYARH